MPLNEYNHFVLLSDGTWGMGQAGRGPNDESILVVGDRVVEAEPIAFGKNDSKTWRNIVYKEVSNVRSK